MVAAAAADARCEGEGLGSADDGDLAQTDALQRRVFRDAARQHLAERKNAGRHDQKEARRPRAGEEHLEEVLEEQAQDSRRYRADEDEPAKTSIGVGKGPLEDAANRTR